MAFDYKEFLAENKLTKVSKGRKNGKAQILSEGIRISEGFDTPDTDMEMDEANKQKEEYEKTKEREKKGNWPGSVGAFVDTHGEELGRAARNRKTLVDYIENVMKPELNDEAKAYVDARIAGTNSAFTLLQALYDAELAGVGLKVSRGSLRERAACDECDAWDETEEVAWEDDGDEYPVDLNEAVNHASLGGERNRKKPGVKPGTANQDKMAKSEMKGEKLDVTIGGVTKTISKQAWSRYRKMTDPEEKKAWKQRHGFIKEAKTLKESLGYIDEVEQDILEQDERGLKNYLRTIWNEYKERIGEGTLYIDMDAHGATLSSNLGKIYKEFSFEED